MKRKLLLTSKGLPEELSGAFLYFLGKSPKKCSVSFITTAAYADGENPEWLDYYVKQLRGYGIENIEELDLKNKTQKELSSALNDKDIIFVNGGNTFYLLYWIRKSGFGRMIYNLLDEGKVYIGVSAGSYVACPTIEAATWKHSDRNKIGLKDLTGLNLVPFLVSTHFEEQYRSVIEKASRSVKYPIVALNDTQAVLVEDSRYKVVGAGRKEFFNGFAENLT